ncbi:MAG: FAD-binding oxidoreductase [Pseudomonadota bacterium]
MTDIIVIGGGIAGISAAARLSAHAQVLVLEGEDALGYHASGRSAALFEESYGAPSVVALNRASAAYHKDGGYLSDRGFMLLARAGEDAGFAADMAALNCPEITVEEARGIVPILNGSVARAAYHAEAYDIDTDKLIQDFARVVRGNGGRVVTGARVQAITRNGAWEVTASGEVYRAPTLVNAAGAWADGIAAMAGVAPVGITPYRRSMARIPAPGGHDVTRWPIFFGVGESWYAKPDAGKLLVSPADEDPVAPHDAWADDMVLAEGLDRYAQHVTEEVTRVETSWAGLRSFAPDRVLVLGRDAAVPEFIWCAGQGGYGMQTSPAASRLVADLALGRAPEIDPDVVASLSPARFA